MFTFNSKEELAEFIRNNVVIDLTSDSIEYSIDMLAICKLYLKIDEDVIPVGEDSATVPVWNCSCCTGECSC